ncbi:MAG TPA: penicillin-binding protein 2 [Gaiellaceae bacterium]|nr:penicillin-binding protein 2 [Gaiellaceae bacterium]
MASTTTELPPLVPEPAPEPEPQREPVAPWRNTRIVRRTALLSGVLLVVFAALFLRLWALQVLTGTKYVQQAQANSFRSVPVQAPRGQILDRTGRPLVTNAVATAVQVWPSDLPRSRYGELKRLSQLTDVPLREIVRGISRHRDDPLTPVIVRADANERLVAYLAEHAQDFPGVTTGRTFIRHYPYQSLAAQLLGYVGAISPQQLRTLGRGYDLNDQIGQAGIESAYDSYLRGVDGTAKRRLDALGRPRSGLVPTQQPKAGHTVRLTLSLSLQKAAEKALQDGISLARADGQWAANGGAIVALDPRDGSILAMASSPTYKPSVYAGRVTNKALAAQGLTRATAQADNYPSLNRATMATYPPGSTFKPVTALAAMELHIISPYSTLPCTPTYTSPDDRSHTPFKNWDPYVDQAMDLPTALAYSCDTYFYQLGNSFYELPGDRGQPLQKWAETFGFGSKTGIDVGPEEAGLVPTKAWREQQFTKRRDPCCWQVDRLWKPGNSIQLAIGQGDLLVTPLQMARFYAMLANGGKLVTPHLLYDVENPNGTPVPTPALPAPKPVDVDPAALQVVRQGLWDGTHMTNGTSYPVFGSFPVAISGKTGTAEKIVSLPGYHGNKDQSWWCGYGPSDDAKLVVCAVIENGGHGGTAAAPAAAEVFASFFGVKYQPTVSKHSD